MRLLDNYRLGIFVLSCIDDLIPEIINPDTTQIVSVYKTAKQGQIDYRIKLYGEIPNTSCYYPLDYATTKLFYYRIDQSEYEQLIRFGIPHEYDTQPRWICITDTEQQDFP